MRCSIGPLPQARSCEFVKFGRISLVIVKTAVRNLVILGWGVNVNRPENLIFPHDTIRLPKSVLADLCREYELEVGSDNLGGYNQAIWRYINSTNDQGPLSLVLNRIFAGQIAVVWFRPSDPGLVRRAAEMLRRGRTNYFERVINIPAEEMDEDRAYVVGAARATLAGETVELVRLRTRAGLTRESDGIEVYWRPTISTATMIFNTEGGYIELRSNSASVPRVLDRIEPIIGIPETVLKPQLIAPFAENLEQVADALGGTAIRADSRPDAFLRRITPEQVQAVMGILDAVSSALRDPDAIDLEDEIDQFRERLVGDVDLTAVPLSVLMLAGFQQIGVTADSGRDVREAAFYQLMRESVHHHGGYISFPVTEDDGSRRDHTIRLGATTNSVAFSTKATEAAIRTVRRVLFDLDEENREAI